MSAGDGTTAARFATRRAVYGMTFPCAAGGDWNVLQGHADWCDEFGHATERIDGVASYRCPRCGVEKPSNDPAVEDAPADEDDAPATCPNGHGEQAITRQGTASGFTGAPIYWVELACGCRDADMSQDVIGWVK
jgi:hypothetical protein